MNASISKVENPRFLQSVLGKYEVLDGEPNVPMALVTRKSSSTLGYMAPTVIQLLTPSRV